ncbi:MAG: hypothetical protein M1839_000926 [Geoglossum umbratile]|nr:MAG: hypothetical protein M1839_000926 [Geoglossum umbratile]
MAVPNGPLPDFAAIRSHLTGAGDQIARCANIPGVQEGNQIAALLGTINVNIQHLREEVGALRGEVGVLQGDVGNLQVQVGNMHREMRAEKRNSIVRLANTRVKDLGASIEPLLGEDGQAIQDFPQTTQALRNLGDERLNEILQRLGLPTAGTLAAKRDRLQMHAGAIDIPLARLR